MAYTQTNRLIAIDTPLGPDVLLLRRMTGQEGISQLFSFDLDLLSSDAAIKFEDIIGKNVTIRVQVDDEEERFFNGYITQFRLIGNDVGLANYQATMVPWLWFLSRTTDCRIFQNVTIPDIIKKIFSDLGFSDFKFNLKTTYPPWDYCVQYRETDFNFVSRLMEQEGIFYYFEHEEQKHTLVVADNPSVHQPCQGQPDIKWNPEGTGILEEVVIGSVELHQQFRPGKYALTDYNFETPSTSLMAQVDTKVAVGNNKKFEVYDYPGEYETKSEGEALAKVRMEEEEAQHFELIGTSNCRVFTSGFRFKLKEYFREDMNREYLLTQVQHSASVGNTYTSRAGGGEQDYETRFVCIPYSIPFRPLRITPRPVVQGPQTAVVVGPKGEEIYVDKLGRVKVQFFWDREGKLDENSSCWIRVSQIHAGKGFGAIDIPRIGEEVIISFLEGDPDLPIIIGRVYNGQNMPPNGLPAAGMVTGLKSNTTPGGGGNNAIMLDDTKGKEGMTIHAQYDMNTTVEHDANVTINTGNSTFTVKTGTHTETIKGDTSITIQSGTMKLDVAAKTYTHHVKGEVTETYDATQSTTVDKDIQIQSKTAMITISAKTEIQLKCGKSLISLKEDGTIKISGENIDVSGGKTAKLGVGNQNITCDTSKAAVSGAAINSSAVGIHEITGAVVKIN